MSDPSTAASVTADPRARVTILVAVRNEEANVAELAENLTATRGSAQIILIDDASTDRTRERLEELLPGTEIVDGPGRGLAAALNRGLLRVKTEYVARADADDRSAPTRFTRQAEFLEGHPELVACGSAVRMHVQGRLWVHRPPTDPDEIHRALLRWNPFSHGEMMLRTEALRAVGGYDERFRFGQDYDLWLRLIQRGPIGCVDEILYDRWPPTGQPFRSKRRGQAWSSARAQCRHFRQTGLISPPHLARHLLSSVWPGPRPGAIFGAPITIRELAATGRRRTGRLVRARLREGS